MNHNYDNGVYLDANFLIAYAGYSIKQSLLKKRAKILFAKLLIEKKEFVVSSLVFDELWYGSRKEIGPKMVKDKIKDRIKFQIGKFLEKTNWDKIGTRLVNQCIVNFSCYEIYDSLKIFTKKLLNSENFYVVQFNDSKNGVLKALENIKEFKLRPRDAFHLAYMRDKGIKEIITNDKDFLREQENMEIKVIGY